MVGRILSALKRRGALHEPPKPAVLLRQHRKLRKRPWAIRKPKYWPIEHPGDLVEIDTKEIRMHRGIILKHFSARDVCEFPWYRSPRDRRDAQWARDRKSTRLNSSKRS